MMSLLQDQVNLIKRYKSFSATLCKKCPYSELFWILFPSFGLNTKYISVFSSNAGKWHFLRSAKIIVLKLGRQHHKEIPILTKLKVLMMSLLQFVTIVTSKKYYKLLSARALLTKSAQHKYIKRLLRVVRKLLFVRKLLSMRACLV